MSVLVVGAGGHAKVVVATLQAIGTEVGGCLDDDQEARERLILGVPVLGPVSLLNRHTGAAIFGIGSNAIRQHIVEEYPSIDWITAVHPSALVHSSVVLGRGSVVFVGAILQPDVHVGCHAIINTGATVDHDGRIGAYAHVSPGVHLSGAVSVQEGSLIGVGACVAPGVTIGAWSTIGAGAAVVCDLPPNVTSVGVPARPLIRA